ncbi:MAG TPA: methyltransferase domain-containing protein [Methylocella sp.]|nr:methyltransferase domain-containing protein [Methylocella sp.]
MAENQKPIRSIADYNEALAEFQRLRSSPGDATDRLRQLMSAIERYEAKRIHAIYRPFQTFFRRKRMAKFVESLGVTDRTRILDLGGNPLNWSFIPQSPDVTMVNLGKELGTRPQTRPGQRMVWYDGGRVPFEDNSFDICYSNSVIEHVGDQKAVEEFASEVRRLAPKYYVQTPYRWFPIEPHFICLFLHWLPRGIQRRLIRWLSLWGWVTRPTQQRVDEMMNEIRLLDFKQMQTLFPDAEIGWEKFLGLTKSLIATKR